MNFGGREEVLEEYRIEDLEDGVEEIRVGFWKCAWVFVKIDILQDLVDVYCRELL